MKRRSKITNLLIILGLSVLAYLAWPKFELFQCRSIQSEAKAWLHHLYEAEKFYFAHNRIYTSLETLLEEGLVNSNEIHYTYDVQIFDSKRLLIVATSKELLGNKKDIWSIDQNGEIKSIQNACLSL